MLVPCEGELTSAAWLAGAVRAVEKSSGGGGDVEEMEVSGIWVGMVVALGRRMTS